jgi:hypothetical protein
MRVQQIGDTESLSTPLVPNTSTLFEPEDVDEKPGNVIVRKSVGRLQRK